MGIKHNCGAAIKQLQSLPQFMEQQLLSALDNAGREAVEIARATKTFKDQSGNLSDSTGYGIVKKGQIVSSGGFGGGEGGSQGRKALKEHAAEVGKTEVALVVVAGMDYAIYVERKGFMVLDGARLRLDNILEQELAKMKIEL